MSKPRVLTQLLLLAGILSTGVAFVSYNSHRVLAAQAKQGDLQAVLSQMNAGSLKFQSAQADIKKEQFEKMVNDTTTQSGVVYVLRIGKSTQMGVKLDNGQAFEFKNGTGRLYDAGTNHITEVSSSGANQAKAETFLTLGFGGSGTDLAREWDINDQGTEQRTDGGKPVSVEKLDLKPKEPSVKENFTHITIWIDPVRDVSLRQEFYTPSGDTQTAIYSNIRLNQKISTDAFAIKCKGKCS
jgi:outer membrane lipoprotein-sorting protein